MWEGKCMKKAFIGIGMIAFLLTGCASEVELSDTESVRVAQYAADLLLKYDSNYKERLLTADEEKIEEEKLRLAAEKEQKLQEMLALKENAEKNQNSQKEDKTQNVDVDQNTAQVVKYNVNDVLCCEGFEISRAGYEVLDEYNNAAEGTEMSVDVQAGTGKKLLVTKYTITNISEGSLECDLFSKDISGGVLVNGSVSANSMVTMLLNDLGTYKAEIEAGVSKEAVLIFEIPDSAASVQQLELTLHVGNENFIIE